MIFDYPSNKFIEDNRPNRLVIHGFAMISQPSYPAVSFEDPEPTEMVYTQLSEIEFIFIDGLMKVLSNGQRITSISNLLFIMSESEVSAAQEQMYRRNMESNNEAMARSNALRPEVKTALQKAIDEMAIANGIVLPENINFFNDKFILYLFPLLRNFTNSSTNFYKVLEDLRLLDGERNLANHDYFLTHELLENKSLLKGMKSYLGTSSKELGKYITANIIKKTELVKSLSPQLLEILISHSGKIFAGTSVDVSNVKILTCYEDINLDVFIHVKFVMDIFDNNVDYAQKFLAMYADKEFKFRSNKNMSSFLRENLTPEKIFSIWEEAQGQQNFLEDVVRQWNTYKDPDSIPVKLRYQYPNGLELPKFQTLKELHDKVSTDYNKIKAEDNNKVIPYSEVEWQVHGLKKDNVELILPSEGATLVTWGKEQEHCVASYADSAADKRCMIVGVTINKKHLYTMELKIHEHQAPLKQDPVIANADNPFSVVDMGQFERVKTYSYRINQFYGYKNRRPEDCGDRELRGIVKELLNTVFTAKEDGLSSSNYRDQIDALAYALGANENVQNIQGLNINVGNVQLPGIINNVAND